MNHSKFNYFQALSSAGNLSLPLPTAYNYPSSHVIVLDSLCASYSASGATTANNGMLRVNVKTNGTGTGNIVWAQTTDIYTTLTGTASGFNFGSIRMFSENGIPLWNATAGSFSNPSVAATSYRIDFTFTGGTLATAGAAVDLAVSFHYEDPACRN